MRVLAAFVPAICLAQVPTVGIIEIYGTKNISQAEIRKALGTSEGGRLPRSKGDVEDKIAAIDGVVAAHVEAACCEDGKAILYVGVEDRGAPHFDYNSEPQAEDVVAPQAVIDAYNSFLQAAREAGPAGEVGEDLSQGHSLMQNAKARYVQLGFVGLAEEHRDALRKVLRESANAEHRAIAAYVLGYSKDKAAAESVLQFALRDSDETVRANALRALGAIAVYARKNPDAGVKVSPTWMIEMLNSLVWTDRHNAAVALVTLTEDREPSMLDQIRSRALTSVVTMARWRHLPHALPAFILAGRVAGVAEDVLQDAWNKEDREPIVRRAAASARE